MDEKKEFTFISLNIVDLSIIYAMFLIIWGMSISIISESNSITSLIPSILGLPILVFSYLSKVFPSKQKLFMHIVVIIGLLIFIGGLDFIRGFLTSNGMGSIWASSSKLMMLISGGVFCYACILSFMHARRKTT
tara:strand:- start:1028 stop:1429 length:402 start_codon:yes stop_codon:yes gene_type:complete